MPEFLKLYERRPLARVESEPAIVNLDPTCVRCALHASAKSRCIPASGDGVPADLLVIGEGPGKEEDSLGHAFVGKTGNYLRNLLSQHWKGSVVLDNATRCFKSGELSEEYVDACRGYLAQTIHEARPKRVLALGKWATYSIFGRSLAPHSVRRGYGWLNNVSSGAFSQAGDAAPVPVFMLIHPAAGLRNRFVKQWFEEDLKWALSANPPKPPWGSAVNVVSTREEAEAACAALSKSDWFAFDVETSGTMFMPDFKVISFAGATYGACESWVWDQAALDNAGTFEPLKHLLLDPGVGKVGQNGKYDALSIRSTWGFWVENIVGDTRLWRKLMEPEAAADLATMAELVGMGGHKGEAEVELAKIISNLRRSATLEKKRMEKVANDPQGSLLPQTLLPNIAPEIDAELRLGADPRSMAYAMIPRETLLRYNARDAVVTAELGAILERRLAAEKPLQRIWDKVVSGAMNAIARVEHWGVPTSRDAALAFKSTIDLRLADVMRRLDAHGGGINWGSAPQLRKLLYDDMKLPIPHHTDSGLPSTDESALAHLKAQGHMIAGDLLDFRFLTKMDGTYATGMLGHIRADGRVHPSIHLDGARSGRTSCSDPNLQNIPRGDSPEGKMARDCFAAPPGYVLIQADYSQLELRIAAMLSGDDKMAEVFRSGIDYHLRTAQMISYVWDKKPEEVGKPERSGAKAFNFGILYGMSDEGIAARAGCTVEQAREIRNAIFGEFTRLKKWIDECLHEARMTGYAWTQWEGKPARRRPLWQIGNEDRGWDDAGSLQKSKAEHSAWNTPVQGTASEYCIASLVKVVDMIERTRLPAEVNLPIHDALLLLALEDRVEEVALEVRNAMTDYDTGNVPLEVDVEVGPSWGSLKKIELP